MVLEPFVGAAHKKLLGWMALLGVLAAGAATARLSLYPWPGMGPAFGGAVAADEFGFYFIYLFLLVAGSGDSGLHGLSGARPRPARRVLCPGSDGNGGNVLYGGLHRSHHDFPGAGDFLHLHLHPGRLPAGRPPLQRSLAEVFSAGIVCHRIFAVWNRFRVRPDGNHQPAGSQRAARRRPRNGRRSRRWP